MGLHEEITGAWDYGTLPRNVVVGRECFLERKDSFARFRSERQPGLVMGDRVSVYTLTTFNVEPGGFIEIGDDSVIAGAIFMCAESVVVGRRVTISYNVTIADSDFHPIDPADRIVDAIANAPCGDKSLRPILTARPIVIGDDALIGLGAIILKGVRIGRGARIAPGAVVTRDVANGVTVGGNPARVIA